LVTSGVITHTEALALGSYGGLSTQFKPLYYDPSDQRIHYTGPDPNGTTIFSGVLPDPPSGTYEAGYKFWVDYNSAVAHPGPGRYPFIGYKDTAPSISTQLKYNNAFNKNDALTDYWESEVSTYTSTSGGSPAVSTSGSERLASNAPYGSWITLKLPYEICLKRYEFTGAGTKSPKEGQIWGSTDGTTWSHVHTFTGGVADVKNNETVSGNTNYYSEYAFITTKITGADTVVRIVEIRYFGTPGPTTLDKGSLSLTRSLDVPRISRYDVDTETPRPEKLVLDFDTTVNSSPTDISGKGNHGAFKGTAQYSPADKAFKFDGNSDYIQTAPLGFSGDQVHSVSLWFWSDVEQSTFGLTEHALWGTGGVSNSAETGFSMYNTFVQVWRAAGATKYPMTFNANQWNHICMAYSSGGSVNSRLWLNGVELAQDSSVTSTGAYSFQASEYLVLGTWINNTTPDTSYPWDGKISNFKLYNVALEPSEVKKLYNLGRTGRSMVISDTAVGIGKAPEAQLDVRGLFKASCMHVPGTVVQVVAANLVGDSSTSDKNSGHRNSFVKLNITPRFKNSAIIADFKFLAYFHSGSSVNGAEILVRRINSNPTNLSTNGTNVYGTGGHNLHYYSASPNSDHVYISLTEIDTPNTLENIYYVMAFRPHIHGNHTISIGNGSNQFATVRIMEIAQ